jgi:predicted nucleic acid-binding protein
LPSVLVDTGIWYAICDGRDGKLSKEDVRTLYDRISLHTILLPWPILYETLRTRFVRNTIALEKFHRELKLPNVAFVDDAPYRDGALNLTIESSLRRNRPLSFVDCLIRLLVDDPNLKITYLATLNARDFADVCQQRRIELWDR